MKRPAITITLLTYNHREYIKECLEGILRQKVSFDVEVLIGDDCSTDGTQDVIREYDKKYPNRFTLILRKQNIGATRNLYDLLKRARGKYIAGLEGDDYWLDDNKLEEQYCFLEQHKEYIGCSHEVKVVDENGRLWCFDGKYIEGRHWTFYKEIFTYADYQKFILPGQGSTYLYRNVFFNPMYDYSIIEEASHLIGDMTLMLILSSQGDWYFDKSKARTCYRYIDNTLGRSWAARTKMTNTTYDDYMYRVRLEQYAKNVLKVNLNLKKTKEEIMYGSYCRMKNSYNINDVEIYKKIIEHSTNSIWLRWKMGFRYRKEKKIIYPVAYAIKTGEFEKNNIKLSSNTWDDFNHAIKAKTIVAFGAGAEFREFLRKYGKRYKVPIVLDNNPKFEGKMFECCKNDWEAADNVYDFAISMLPQCINDWDKDKFVILITSSLYGDQISEQLDSVGFSNYYSFGAMESKLNIYNEYKRMGVDIYINKQFC